MLMLTQHIGFNAFQADAGYTTASIRVSGDRVAPSLTSAPTSAEFLISFWIRLKGTMGYIIQEQGNLSILEEGGTRQPGWSGFTGITGAVGVPSVAIGNDTWSHYIISCSVANNRYQCYVDGASAISTTASGAGHNFAATNGWFNYQDGSSAPTDAEIAEWYMHCSAQLDLSVAANVQKFRTTGGKPVNLGADGSTPTGSQPHYYHTGGTQAAFLDNKGSLGDATVSHGALANGASSPSD